MKKIFSIFLIVAFSLLGPAGAWAACTGQLVAGRLNSGSALALFGSSDLTSLAFNNTVRSSQSAIANNTNGDYYGQISVHVASLSVNTYVGNINIYLCAANDADSGKFCDGVNGTTGSGGNVAYAPVMTPDCIASPPLLSVTSFDYTCPMVILPQASFTALGYNNIIVFGGSGAALPSTVTIDIRAFNPSCQ